MEFDCCMSCTAARLTQEGTDGHQYVTGLLVAHLVTKDDPAPGGTAVEVQTGSGSRAGTGEPPRKRAKLAANLRVPGNADEQGEAAVPAPAEELVDEEELAQEGMADEGAEQQHPAIQAAGAQAPGKVPAAAGAQAARAPAQHTQRPTIPKPQQAPAAQPSQKAPQRVSRGGSSSDDTRVTQEVPSKQDGQAGGAQRVCCALRGLFRRRSALFSLAVAFAGRFAGRFGTFGMSYITNQKQSQHDITMV
jgi:hypothetical protein